MSSSNLITNVEVQTGMFVDHSFKFGFAFRIYIKGKGKPEDENLNASALRNRDEKKLVEILLNGFAQPLPGDW